MPPLHCFRLPPPHGQHHTANTITPPPPGGGKERRRRAIRARIRERAQAAGDRCLITQACCSKYRWHSNSFVRIYRWPSNTYAPVHINTVSVSARAAFLSYDFYACAWTCVIAAKDQSAIAVCRVRARVCESNGCRCGGTRASLSLNLSFFACM